MKYRLGKKPARKDAVTFKFASFTDSRKLPPLPRAFGRDDLIGDADWGMLGNDRYGCCVFAGAAHEHMLWSRIGDAPDCDFSTKAVLADYAAVTGFDPDDPASDQGTDMAEAASYRRKTGIADRRGRRHRVRAYLALDPHDVQQLWHAIHLFGAVGIGLWMPAHAMRQFDAGKPWTVARGAEVDGGHYVTPIAKRGFLRVVTWGREHPMSRGFYEKYNDETVAYVSDEVLIANRSPNGFDADGLVTALKAVSRV